MYLQCSAPHDVRSLSVPSCVPLCYKSNLQEHSCCCCSCIHCLTELATCQWNWSHHPPFVFSANWKPPSYSCTL